MGMLDDVSAGFSLWIGVAAQSVGRLIGTVKAPRRVEACEGENGLITLRLVSKAKSGDGALPPCEIAVASADTTRSLPAAWAAILRGAEVELVLRRARFIFRPLELPNRAMEFLDGVVRAQIDRLTPWNAADAIYHWTPPQHVGGDNIAMTIVATNEGSALPLAQAFLDLGAAGIEISTNVSDSERLAIYRRRAVGQSEFGRARFAMIAILATTGALAFLSASAGAYLADSYDADFQQMQQEILSRRAVLRAGQNGTGNSALDVLVRRKHETPSSVLIIEALSSLLPDHTYATEVRIEGDKLQVVGLTRDAPSLIQILEQSPHFSSAGFFAPTTRSTNEPGERFHIEAKLKPYFGTGS